MKISQGFAVATVLLAATASVALATGAAKDIVLDRVVAPVITTQAAPITISSDAMIVSVLLESADGVLTPKSTQALFRTGDRFRIKVLASRNGKISLYNTNPLGVTTQTPIWQGEVKVGMDTISPRLVLDGNSGVDKLHVVLEPTQESNMFGWLGNWLRSSPKSDSGQKDIRLDQQSTANATYLLNAGSQGIVTTVSIVHR